jgi:hypothetical protein
MTLVLNYAEGSVYLESDMTDQEITTMAGEYGAWLNGTEIVFTDRGFVEFARALGKAEKQDVDWEAVAADQAMTIAMMKSEQDEMCPRCGATVVNPYKQREWLGLTDEQIAEAVGSPVDEVYLADFRKVEAKLREVNT